MRLNRPPLPSFPPSLLPHHPRPHPASSIPPRPHPRKSPSQNPHNIETCDRIQGGGEKRGKLGNWMGWERNGEGVGERGEGKKGGERGEWMKWEKIGGGVGKGWKGGKKQLKNKNRNTYFFNPLFFFQKTSIFNPHSLHILSSRSNPVQSSPVENHS